MALIFKVLRTCSLLLYCGMCVFGLSNNSVDTWIVSFRVDNFFCDQNVCKYYLLLNGGPFLGHNPLRLTPWKASRGSYCESYLPNYEIKEIETAHWSSRFEVTVANSDARTYFCLHHSNKKYSTFSGEWIHQGPSLYLNSKNDASGRSASTTTSTEKQWPTEQETTQHTSEPDLSQDININYIDAPTPNSFEKPDIEVLNQINVQTYNNRDIHTSNDRLKNTKNKVIDDNEPNLIRKKRNLITSRDNIVNLSIKNNNHESNSINNNNITHNNNNEVGKDNKVENNNNTKVGIDNEVRNNNNTEVGNNNEVKNNNTEVRNDNEVRNNNNTEVGNDNEVKNNNNKVRKGRQVMPFDLATVKPVAVAKEIKLDGIRIEHSDKPFAVVDDNVPSVFANSKLTVRLFGEGITAKTVIALTDVKLAYGQPCKFLLKGEYKIKQSSIKGRTAIIDITAPIQSHDQLYFCAKTLQSTDSDHLKDDEKYIHQGSDPWVVMATHEKSLPLWAQVLFIMICLTFSALFSGLNLGLMSLDKTELKIIANTGSPQEKKYAKAIMPVRDHGNYLLCSILLGNVAVNSTLTLLLDDLTSGVFAVIASTLLIVILGEITPQAICSRHGLMVGARTIVITKAVMAIQAPLSYPVSKLLDYFLGEEIGNVYNRERLKELVKVTRDLNDLDKYEVNIISGALELRKKTVADIMTKIEDVFMLPISSILDFETMNEIINSGFSRIPVYEGSRTNIVTVLFVKDLAFVDPDDNTPLKTLCQYYQNPCNFVFEDVTLDIMFRQFKDGSKGHMAFVHRVNDQGDTDPFYEVIGLLTLEDVIEEMIQAEILDETDVYTDNTHHLRRRMRPSKLQDFSAFAQRRQNNQVNISPQLTLATFQFLSTSVEEFRPDLISETVLRRLLKQDIIHHIKVKGKNKKDPTTYVFQAGKPVDYFVLILEGRVEVTVGREKLVFEAGPFTYFGIQALAANIGVQAADSSPTVSSKGSLSNINMDSILRHSFVPDYSVRAVAELYYLTVRRSLYLAAKRATLMEQSALSKGTTNEQFDTEVDKLLEGVDGDDLISIHGDNKTPSRQISPYAVEVIVKPSPAYPGRNGDVYVSPPDEHDKLLSSN